MLATHIHTLTHMHVHTLTHTHMHARMHAHMHAHMHTRMHTHAKKHAYTYTLLGPWPAHVTCGALKKKTAIHTYFSYKAVLI